jgi:ribosome biogenesis GTPase
MRVSIEHQDRYTLIGETKQCDAHLRGRLLQEAKRGGPRPVVGDWVGLSEEGTIHHLFERSTAFQRISPRGRVQVIAANVDQVFIVTSCNAEFNLRRIERYLSAVWDSGARAVVVLTKIDLCDDPDSYLAQLDDIIGDTPVFAVATPSGVGVDEIRPLLERGKSIALVGSSGVGKSTLANALLGVPLFKTAEIREEDAKGRHTTTRRELVVLSDDRGILIDTPGMRELQVTSAESGLDTAFADIQELAAQCQFRDCRHLQEPGCAVRDKISPSRLKNFQTLRAEGKSTRAEKSRTAKTVHRGSTRGGKRKGKTKR